MSLNNLYNFKKPVRFFIDIESLAFPDDLSSYTIKNLCWVKPFNFRVKKNEDKFRTLKIPNILNFVTAYGQFKNLPSFDSIQDLDSGHKRLSANIVTGDFVSGEYDKQLEKDFNMLCVYDILLKVDIKEYYGRIYTHYIGSLGNKENYLTNMNLGQTNGLIMGNYLSLYFAELNLKNISNDIEKKITDLQLNCEFNYFSDDFYFFCNKGDAEIILRIFDEVLEKYELERNEDKKEEWTYETFNNYNLVGRYWKKMIAECNIKYYNYEKEEHRLHFINQIIYRMSNLSDRKLKTVFINNFFKTRYFREMIDLEKYTVMNYDYHQLCFILKFSPEAFLYTADKFNAMSNFNNQKLVKFLEVRYREALQKQFYDEQLYYYYAISIFGFSDIFEATTQKVLLTNNQLLISYYLKDGLFSTIDINKLKEMDDEHYWFQNYHLILYSPDLKADLEGSVRKYLMPDNAKKPLQESTYMEFYKNNISLNKSIIRSVPEVNDAINDYLTLKIEENNTAYENKIATKED
ncbi:hypothetical protein HYG86_06100 [Alkalicella caledoniensis]|uniref:Reverse transcriptase (RNA-dependent DNA polymerase) n=1 Tax=Alkalicella caledoniensis TaxID=2731377 RepID=A0A7G9W6R1_ALKCA|nr:hypothetical protein [Alkalicella caledoniensis]QNO14373.1 hypothetical protein HYG86_06100 [Alkalicella caledoniensis]